MVNLNWWPSFRKLFVAHASSPKEHQTESEASWWQHSALGLFFSSVGTGAFVSVSGNYMKRFKYMSALAQNCQISARMQTKIRKSLLEHLSCIGDNLNVGRCLLISV